jgi:pyruvate-formate lyase-activating enzyme
MNILSTTTCDCPECAVPHVARYERSGKEVWFVVDCPHSPPPYLVSSDADLFIQYRLRAGFDFSESFPHAGYRHVNVFEITNQCDYACAFCFASANTPSPLIRKNMSDILEMGRTILAEGGYAITITGGEPTLHPDIVEVVRQLKSMGLVVTMPSNGHRLAADPGLARNLAKAGLDTVAIQFDTFDPEVQKRHRNNDWVKEKMDAVSVCAHAGLKILLQPTVTRHNLREIGDIIRYGISERPAVYGVNVQPYFEDATKGLAGEDCVTREDVVHAIVDSGVVPGLGWEDFWPLPKYYGLRIAIHPDCGVVAPLVIHKGSPVPLSRLVDMAAFYRRLANANRPMGFHQGIVVLGYHLICSALNASARATLSELLSPKRGSRSATGLLLVVIEQFFASKYQDDDRKRRCASAMRTERGINQHGCFANRLWHGAASVHGRNDD